MNRVMTDEAKEMTIDELCGRLATLGRRHNHGYFHYTKWESFSKMQAVNNDELGNERRFLKLSSKNVLNDAFEKRMEDGTFVFCFSIGEEECIAQWKIYGADQEDAVRLKFRQSALSRWLRSFDKGAIKVYVKQDEQYLPIERKCRARLIDVAYPSSNENRNLRMISVGNEKVHMVEGWKDKIMQKKYAPFFKKQGWSYEREVRLVIDKTGLDVDYIYVPFDDPFKSLIDDFKNGKCPIMRGPWFNEKSGKRLVSVRGIELARALKSDYEGEIRKTNKEEGK